MSTIVSNDDPYATAEEFLDRFDFRVIADLCTDDSSKPTVAELKDNTTKAGNRLYQMLRDASGDVESAVLLGGRYSVTDLTSLTGNAQATLVRIISGIAIDYLAKRRADANYLYSAERQQAQEFLVSLANGDRIFAIREVVDAGLMDHEIESPEVVKNRNLVTWQMRRLFGTRANRVPPPQ